MDKDSDGEKTTVALKRKITLFNGICMIVGGIIGGGIFISPKGVLAGSGSIGVSLIVWAACGVFSIAGSLCYLELGFSIPKSGAGYAYILEGFGELPAFLFLWVEFLIRNPTSEAISALTFASYVAQPFFPHCEAPQRLKTIIAALCLNCYVFLTSRGEYQSPSRPVGYVGVRKGRNFSSQTTRWFLSHLAKNRRFSISEHLVGVSEGSG
ncbi:hypothetical protein Bbelb_031380 [Branchiostoma belcheri]|nr:hypothetical protein Bbelb_031380 [Branchiostoma belcheri]